MGILPYIRLMRPDHWFKNIFMLPGVCLALFFSSGLRGELSLSRIALALLTACLVASSNYVINEILDAAQDRHHPEKKDRPLASGQASVSVAYALWLVLAAVGLGVAFTLGLPFGLSAALLWVMGLVYNVRPLRFKDVPYLDVICEAVNNPIRLAMGWYATGLDIGPPLSVGVAYWMFGCFLMAVKRFAEYRHIACGKTAASYRKSFRFYDEERLLESIAFYASLFAMMSGIFISRYCVRLVLATPLVAYCMAYYLHLGFKPNSPVQHPEHLLVQKNLMAVVMGTFIVCTVLLFLDIPGFDALFTPRILPS